METSRDDFVIAIRSAFLNKGYKQRFSLIGLIFFSIIILVLGRLNFKAIDYIKLSIKEVVYRSSFIVSVPENYIKESYIKIENHFIYYNDYIEIKDELEKIEAQNLINNFIITENKRLKKIIDDYFVESSDIVAKVLIDKKSPFLKSVVVNKGSKDNISLGMAVMNNSYLVGKIVEVNYLTSRALLLSDLNSKIPVTIEPGGTQSILSGTGGDIGIIQYQKDKSLIADQSIVYTSGSGGIFKSGIPVGKIKTKLFKLIDGGKVKSENQVSFFSDLSQLKFVKIVSYKKEVLSD